MKLRLSVSATISLLLLARLAFGAVSPLQSQIDAAQGTLTVDAGTYNGDLNLKGKWLVAKQVVTPRIVMVNGEPRATGPNVILNGVVTGGSVRGVVTNGGNPGLYRGNLQLPSNATAEDSIAQGSMYGGVSIQGASNVTLRRVAMQDNKACGYTAGDNNGVTLEDCWALGNNRGVSAGGDPFFGHGKSKNGLWYADTGDEGGGGKIARSKNLTFLRCRYAYNGGIGWWTDWDDSGVVVKDCEADHNIALLYGWDGQGFDTECDLSVTFDNCYTHDNQSVGIQLCEPANVKVVNCHIADSLHVRTMSGRNHPAHDNSITGNIFYGGASIHYDGGPTWTNNTLSPNTMNAALPVTWKSSGGTTQPPPPPPPDDPALHPVDPGKESANGATIPPLAVLRDKVTALWAITKSQQIARDGVVMDQTNGVNQLYYINGFVYQRAHDNQYWFYNGAEWKTATLPTTQPNTPPPADDPVIKVEPIGGWRITHKSGKTETTP